jgi:hypothetical protein
MVMVMLMIMAVLVIVVMIGPVRMRHVVRHMRVRITVVQMSMRVNSSMDSNALRNL